MNPSEETAADNFIRAFKEQLRPELLRGVPDDFIQPGREAELGRLVERVVDARLIRGKVPIGRRLRIMLIESLMADIERAKNERFGLR